MSVEFLSNPTYASAKSYAQSLSDALTTKYGVTQDVNQTMVNFRATLDNIRVPDAEEVLKSGSEQDITDYYNLVSLLNKGKNADLLSTEQVMQRRAYDHFGVETAELKEAQEQFKDWFFQAREAGENGNIPSQLTVDAYQKYAAGEITDYQGYLDYAQSLNDAKQQKAEEVASLRSQLDEEVGHYTRRFLESELDPKQGAKQGLVNVEALAEQAISNALVNQGMDSQQATSTAGSIVFHGMQHQVVENEQTQAPEIVSALSLEKIVETVQSIPTEQIANQNWQTLVEQTRQSTDASFSKVNLKETQVSDLKNVTSQYWETAALLRLKALSLTP